MGTRPDAGVQEATGTMRVLTDTDLAGLLPPASLVTVVEDAARAQAAGQTVTPPRAHLDWDNGTLLTMPAIAAEVFGTKLVCVIPDNAARGLPVTNGLMILNDRHTGAPLALLNAAALTAQRTGAVGALGVKYMTPADTHTVGIIGTGVQGAWQAICACAVRPIREVLYLARSPASRARFEASVRALVPAVQLTPCADARDLLARTTLVIAATTSATPVLPEAPELLAGKHFISIGSFKPTMQELPYAVYRLAGELAIDSEAARQEVGDVLLPLAKGILAAHSVFWIGDLITGRRSVDVHRTTAYKSVGMALYDLYVAKAFFEAARRGGIGREINI
jgi:ornithine cyclodeaminase